MDHDERPVVFIFAGKAHPADEPGQRLMQEVHRVANLPEFFGKILLVEGYDMDLASLLTSGVDIWLNNPIYPMEASGTSGMKAAINGTVNLSVLDGWWAEGYDGTNGWAIPPASNNGDDGERDRQDARTLYEILQDDVIPLYYQHDEKLGYAPGWVNICKRSMASVLPHFNSHRLLHDYACSFYGPGGGPGPGHVRRCLCAGTGARRLEGAGARCLAGCRRCALPIRFQTRWTTTARCSWRSIAQLNGLSPEDLRIECVVHRDTCSQLTVPVKQYSEHGRSHDGVCHIGDETVFVAPFTPAPGAGVNGECSYRLELAPPWCGGLRYEIRALPQHRRLTHPYETGLMRWL